MIYGRSWDHVHWEISLGNSIRYGIRRSLDIDEMVRIPSYGDY